MPGEITCPWCGGAWTDRIWTAGGARARSWPAYTVCVYCTQAAYIDRGTFG